MKTTQSTRSVMVTCLGVCALLGVMVVGQAQGATYVRYKSNGDYFALTNDTANAYGWMWPTLPGASDTARVNYGGMPGNTVTLSAAAPLINNFQIGVDESGYLIVNAGGVLTTKGGTSTVGNNNTACIGRMTVNTGGQVIVTNVLTIGNTTSGFVTNDGGSMLITSHLWMGNASSIVGLLRITNGGVVSVGGNIGLGTGTATSASGGKGYVYVQEGGVLNLSQISPTNSIQPNSVLDVSGSGVVILPNDYTSVLSYYTNVGRITSYGGLGTVGIDYNNLNALKTTLFAIAPAVPPPTNEVWNPSPYGTGKWNEATNWSSFAIPAAVTKVVFNVPDAIPCTVTNAAVAQYVVMGDNGPGGTLVITNGGSLSCSGDNWTAIGYNSNALMVVENGGSADFGYHLWIGLNPGGDGTLTMNGGTVSVAGMFGLGWQGGKGTAHINGGTLNLAQWSDYGSIVGASVLDVSGTGKVVINGNRVTSVETYVGSGQITANGGTGTVAVDYNHLYVGKTTIYPAGLSIPPEQTVWNPALNAGDTAGLWNVSSNWLGAFGPTGITKVVFNVPDAIPCTVTNAVVAGRIVMGDSGGPGGTLIVTNGGSLAVGAVDWSSIGYASNAQMVVENGGSATFAYQLWVGFNPGADGTLTINGGTVLVTGMFGLGWNGGKGTAHINDGTLNLALWDNANSIKGASVMDVAGTGKVVITGDQTLSVSNYVNSGKITANGGPNVYYLYTPGANKTTISAVSLAPPRQLITGATVGGGSVTLTYQTTAGNTYHIEGTPSLSSPSWTTVPGSTTNATGAPVTFTFPVSGDQRFYRTVSP